MNIELTIDKIVFGGDGIGQYNGIKVFVPYSAPQDHLLVSITKKKKDYWVGKVKEIIEPSPFRIQPPCPYFFACGGCTFQHITYDSQLVVKKLLANETLQRVGKVYVPVKNPLPAPSEWHYRNKTQYPVVTPYQIGFFKRKTHQIIDIENCLLHPTSFDRIRNFLKQALIAANETAYDENNQQGNIRHIIIRQGFNTGEFLIIIVTKENNLNSAAYQELTNNFTNIVGIVQNINPAKTNRILGDKSKILVGQDYYHEKILNKQFRISVESFFQVNTAQTETLINKVLQFLKLDGSEHILDLFSGVGIFAIVLAESVAQVTGIEISQTAIADAKVNLKLNNIDNVEFFCATAEQGIKKFKQIDAVIIDPPRKGCSKELLENIGTLKPKRIVYVSCNPATLARDLAIFDQLGYEATEIELVDLFPQTYHIEAVAKIIPKVS